MKRGFTLVELLVVTVVIVTLMAVAFRVSIRGVDATRRAWTISRLQKLENCLSGYYAAYGSYPPVPLHGSRDYTLMVNARGIQKIGYNNGNGEHWPAGEMASNWESVKAACRCQPVGFECPFPVSSAAEITGRYSELSAAYDDLGFTSEEWKNGDSRWEDVQLFKLGLLSFLLPRLVIMFNGCQSNDKLFELLDNQKQWLDNSDLPINFETGQPYASWKAASHDLIEHNWKLLLQPSQSVCARWIANLSGIVRSTPLRKDGNVAFDYTMGDDKAGDWQTLYGVNIRDGNTGNNDPIRAGDNGDPYDSVEGKQYYVQPGGGPQSDTGAKYVLRWCTVKDGFGLESWPYDGMDFYYYSQAPYQTYILWSSGPNRLTFPQWVTEEDLKDMNPSDLRTAQEWMADDIVHMKN